MLKADQIPERVRWLLTQLHELEPQAIIAGGYLRDLDHGVEPKDIDVFVPQEFNTVKAEQLLHAEASFAETVPFPPSCETDDTIFDQVIWEVPGIDLPINVLRCVSGIRPAERIARFDMSLCQIAFDGDTIWYTSEYAYDKVRKQFTMTRCNGHADFVATTERHLRISKRYPGYKLVIPPHFGKFDPDNKQ